MWRSILILAIACAVLAGAPLDRKDVEYSHPGGTHETPDTRVAAVVDFYGPGDV